MRGRRCASCRFAGSRKSGKRTIMRDSSRYLCLSCTIAIALCLGGCASLPDYVNHGFKVGPEYSAAKAEVASNWIDSGDSRVGSRAADLSRWWAAFNDPELNDLV